VGTYPSARLKQNIGLLILPFMKRVKFLFPKAVLYPSNRKEGKYQDFTSALEADLDEE